VKRKIWLWFLLGVVALGLLAFIPGGMKEDFAVAGEFNLEPIVRLPAIGPFNLSVNKAVIYLWLATAIIIVLAVVKLSRLTNATDIRLWIISAVIGIATAVTGTGKFSKRCALSSGMRTIWVPCSAIGWGNLTTRSRC